MSTLKSAWEIAYERHSPAPPPTRRYQEQPAVVVEKNSIVIDPDAEDENPNKDFYVTDKPSKICGSRAMSVDERKETVAGVRLNRVSGIAVHYEGPMLSHSGYSSMNRAVVDGLRRAGVEVRTHITLTPTDVLESVAGRFRKLEDTDVPDNSPKISGLTVPQNVGHQGRKILYTMMETSNEVHPDFVGRLNLTSEVWVPSQYLADILVECGLHPPVHVMPLGVDTSKYTPEAKPMKLGGGVKGFRFLSVFNWGFRKGWDVLLKAYLEEFSSKDDVSLVLSVKSLGNPEGIDNIISRISDFKKGIRKPASMLPHMVLHTANVDENDMPGLYTSANAFVLLSRGEGMGLPYLEAGACGLPVIATNCTAQGTFLNENNSYLVEPDSYTRHQITDQAFGNMARLCRFYEGQFFPKLGSQAITQARSHMREIYDGLAGAKIKGEQLRMDICSGLTWNHAINRITSRLKELQEEA